MRDELFIFGGLSMAPKIPPKIPPKAPPKARPKAKPKAGPKARPKAGAKAKPKAGPKARPRGSSFSANKKPFAGTTTASKEHGAKATKPKSSFEVTNKPFTSTANAKDKSTNIGDKSIFNKQVDKSKNFNFLSPSTPKTPATSPEYSRTSTEQPSPAYSYGSGSQPQSSGESAPAESTGGSAPTSAPAESSGTSGSSAAPVPAESAPAESGSGSSAPAPAEEGGGDQSMIEQLMQMIMELLGQGKDAKNAEEGAVDPEIASLIKELGAAGEGGDPAPATATGDKGNAATGGADPAKALQDGINKDVGSTMQGSNLLQPDVGGEDPTKNAANFNFKS